MAAQTSQGSSKPDQKTLQEAGDLEIFDETGKALKFEDLYNTENRAVVVFIRHFFCGVSAQINQNYRRQQTAHTWSILTTHQHCEDYVREITKYFPPKDLERSKPTTNLSIIGCGEPSAIANYKQRTGTPFPIYCDPSRKLYVKLGMTSSLSMGDEKPDYIKTSILNGTLKSMGNMLTAGTGIWKGGDFSQNGGEWVFVDGNLEWCHRMQHTRDHAEVEDLGKVLGYAMN
jgi:hypothetical protein